MPKLSRREFVAATGAALASAASPNRVYAQATPGPVTRRAIGTMAPNDPMLASYRLAVERMKALPNSDPRNWNRLAQTHVTFCPHGNWYFLPWHRAYLASFERICRQLSGNANFALPYWDWTEQRQLPAAFTAQTVGGRRNSLFDQTRQMNGSLRNSAVGPTVISRLMAETNYEMFGSTRPTGQNDTSARWLRAPSRTTLLEGGPHNSTHVAIGGNMSDMASPRDPIFWLHHCNVDRMWARWNAQGRRNTTNQMWATYPFAGMFVSPQGNGTTPFNVRVADMLNHTALGYTYPDLPRTEDFVPGTPEAELSDLRVITSEAPIGPARLGTTLSTRLTLPRAATVTEAGRSSPSTPGPIDLNALLREGAPLAGPGGGASNPTPPPTTAPQTASVAGGRIFSIIENITAPRGNGAIVNVFLNSPGPKADAPETDQNFVGTFGVFGLQEHAAMHNGVSLQIELTPNLARLREANTDLDGQLNVQLVPVEARGDNFELKLERINLSTL
jgi:tyrosinase